MKKRESFLQAVFNGDISEFLHFIQLHVSKYGKPIDAGSGEREEKKIATVLNVGGK